MITKTKNVLVNSLAHAKLKCKDATAKFIGPIEKSFKALEIKPVPASVYDDIDFSVLPRYICYRAALLREKQTIKLVLVLSICAFLSLYTCARLEISKLQERLRLKEYILAPGVVDFTPAAPQMISDQYIVDAVNDFVSNLGNVNPSTIEDQYKMLTRFMSDKLRIEFELDTADWVEQVKDDDISQIFTINDRQVFVDDKGWYKAVVMARADFYANRSYLGHENHAVEMTLKLMPPEAGKRWYIQIETLTWNREATYDTKQKMSK